MSSPDNLTKAGAESLKMRLDRYWRNLQPQLTSGSSPKGSKSTCSGACAPPWSMGCLVRC